MDILLHLDKHNEVLKNKDDVYNIRLFFKYTLIRDKRFINEVIDGSEMVKEINDTVVDDEEILSNNVYYYNIETDQISISNN